MTKSTLTMILAAAAAVSPAVAQSPFGMRLVSNVPFAFHQQDQAYPAGRYQIKQGPSNATMMLSDRTGRNLGIVITNERQIRPREQGFLTFQCYENSGCFLHEIAEPGSNRSKVIPAGKLEKEVRRGAGVKVARVETTLTLARVK